MPARVTFRYVNIELVRFCFGSKTHNELTIRYIRCCQTFPIVNYRYDPFGDDDGNGKPDKRKGRESEELARGHAVQLGLGAGAEFSKILPLLPGDLQPLMQALVRENNDLLRRVQARARQNHLLLRQSMELMQRLLSWFDAPLGEIFADGFEDGDTSAWGGTVE